MKKAALLFGLVLLFSCESQIPERCKTCIVETPTATFTQEYCGDELDRVLNGKADTERMKIICGSQSRH